MHRIYAVFISKVPYILFYVTYMNAVDKNKHLFFVRLDYLSFVSAYDWCNYRNKVSVNNFIF